MKAKELKLILLINKSFSFPNNLILPVESVYLFGQVCLFLSSEKFLSFAKISLSLSSENVKPDEMTTNLEGSASHSARFSHGRENL